MGLFVEINHEEQANMPVEVAENVETVDNSSMQTNNVNPLYVEETVPGLDEVMVDPVMVPPVNDKQSSGVLEAQPKMGNDQENVGLAQKQKPKSIGPLKDKTNMGHKDVSPYLMKNVQESGGSARRLS